MCGPEPLRESQNEFKRTKMMRCEGCGFSYRVRGDGCLDVKFLMDNSPPTKEQEDCLHAEYMVKE